jgi:hypothetical protein
LITCNPVKFFDSPSPDLEPVATTLPSPLQRF